MFTSSKRYSRIKDCVTAATWAYKRNQNDQNHKSKQTVIKQTNKSKPSKDRSFSSACLSLARNSLSHWQLSFQNPTAVGKLFHPQDVKLAVWSWCKGSGNHHSNGDGWSVDYRWQQENNKKVWQKAAIEVYNDRSHRSKDASVTYIMNKQEWGWRFHGTC